MGSNVVSIYSVSRNSKLPMPRSSSKHRAEPRPGLAAKRRLCRNSSRHNLVRRISTSRHGRRSESYTVMVNGNTFSAQQASRPYFDSIPTWASSIRSTPLYIQLQRPASYAAQQLVAWSHQPVSLTLGVTTWITPATSITFPRIPPICERLGNANDDIRSHFAAYFNYNIASVAHDRSLDAGWEVNGILSFRTASRSTFSPVMTAAARGERGPRQHHRPGPQQQWLVQQHSYAQYLNPNSFVTQPMALMAI